MKIAYLEKVFNVPEFPNLQFARTIKFGPKVCRKEISSDEILGKNIFLACN